MVSFTTTCMAVLMLYQLSLCEPFKIQDLVKTFRIDADVTDVEGKPFKIQDLVKTFRIDADVTDVEGNKPTSDLGKKPDFCHELDCPSFTVVKKAKDYEERSYVASGWVSTHLEGTDYDAASRTMFMKLFGYIQGQNAKKEKIAMTAPVIVSVIPGPGPACKSNFTMSFFLSPSLESPPKPTNEDVFLSFLPKQKVYVRSFGGFAFESDWLKNAEALAKSLVRDSQSYRDNYFFSAGYDSPFAILHRHNEVWYVAK